MSDLDQILSKETFVIDGKEIVLDRNRIVFDEATLGRFQQQMHLWYDYFGALLADLEHAYKEAEFAYKDTYDQKFIFYKEKGGSDKFAESQARVDPNVQLARSKMLELEKLVSKVKNHLRAWDKGYQNAISRSYTLRKEMDKFNLDLYQSGGGLNIDEIVT